MTATTAGTPLPRGRSIMHTDFMTAIRRTPPGPQKPRPLTNREIEVLQLVAEGLTNPEIGRELWVTADTVKTSLARLRRKLKAKDRAHAVAQGFRAGVLS
jgi:DNA-binding NarL/FixJ family response regulator